MVYNLSKHNNCSNIFLINHSDIMGRIDSYFYSPNFKKLEDKLHEIGCVPLSKLIRSITNGFDFRDYVDSGTPYLKVANVKQGELDFSKIQYINFDSSQISKKIQLAKGNLLLTRKGTYGNAYSLKRTCDFVISSEIFYIELKQELISSDYLEIILNSNIGQKQFDRNKIGAIMGSLSQDAVKQILIPIISRDGQQQIVDLYNAAYEKKKSKDNDAKKILDSIDGYLLQELGIKLPDRMDSYKEDIPVWMNSENPLVKNGRLFMTNFSEVTKKRIDPYYHKNYFANAFSALENSKYSVDTLKNISKKITSGITPLSGGDSYTNESEGIPFIRSGNIDINGELNFEDLLYIKREVHNTTMKSSQVKYGDLMIAIVGATIGQVGVYLYRRDANINQAIALVRLNQEIDFQYIKELIKSSIGQLSLARLKRPVARANINLEEIATMKVILPPIAKQIEIASYILNLRQQAKQLYFESEQSVEIARLEIEQIILGE